MPYRKRICTNLACGREWEPRSFTDGEVCRQCKWEATRLQQAQTQVTWSRRDCEVCAQAFDAKPGDARCGRCRKLATQAIGKDNQDQGYHYLAPPLKQCIFDLETFTLDRGWGVLMVGCLLVHGEGPEPVMYTFDQTQSSTWPDVRSNDKELAIKILDVLRGCHVAYAHNAMNFDIRWLNSLALKWDLQPLSIRVVDPIRIARNKYRIGRNALGNLANFLGLEEKKMPIPEDTWRFALMDNHRPSWDLLRDRCESDVRILNTVAGKLIRDAGMIDRNGSFWG